MQAVLCIGIPATGKSTFCRQRFAESHIRLNLDMLRTRHRERLLLEACLAARQSFVVDNTNLTRADRARYIKPARAAKFRVIGYYFESRISDALVRNSGRAEAERIPERGVRGASGRLELPDRVEGFDELYHVSIGGAEFRVEEWRDAV